MTVVCFLEPESMEGGVTLIHSPSASALVEHRQKFIQTTVFHCNPAVVFFNDLHNSVHSDRTRHNKQQ